VAQLRLVQFICNIDLPVKVAQGVLAWHPEWPLYQSRLLAPSLLWLLGSNATAYLLLAFFALTIGGWLSWNLSGLAGLAIYHAAFAILLSPLFYPWDILEPVVFMVFVSFVAAGRSQWWFVGLYAVAIFNRQTAQFIAMWMVVDPLCRRIFGARRLDRKMLVAGIACMVAGVAMIWNIQGRAGFVLAKNGNAWLNDYFQYRLGPNLSDLDILDGAFRDVGFHVTPVILLAIIGLILGAVVHLVRRDPERFLGLGLMYLTILAAIPAFGIFGETRVFLDFIPLFVVAGIGLSN